MIMEVTYIREKETSKLQGHLQMSFAQYAHLLDTLLL